MSITYLTAVPSRLAEREYHEETQRGFIEEDHEEEQQAGQAQSTQGVLTPPGSPPSRQTTITPSIGDVPLHDLEKGKSRRKLVTFKEGDAANPRNWSNTFRWCKHSSLFQTLPSRSCACSTVGQTTSWK
jgi:hypothetical protein